MSEETKIMGLIEDCIEETVDVVTSLIDAKADDGKISWSEWMTTGMQGAQAGKAIYKLVKAVSEDDARNVALTILGDDISIEILQRKFESSFNLEDDEKEVMVEKIFNVVLDMLGAVIMVVHASIDAYNDIKELRK